LRRLQRESFLLPRPQDKPISEAAFRYRRSTPFVVVTAWQNYWGLERCRTQDEAVGLGSVRAFQFAAKRYRFEVFVLKLRPSGRHTVVFNVSPTGVERGRRGKRG
jgi:hypothetical protein